MPPEAAADDRQQWVGNRPSPPAARGRKPTFGAEEKARQRAERVPMAVRTPKPINDVPASRLPQRAPHAARLRRETTRLAMIATGHGLSQGRRGRTITPGVLGSKADALKRPWVLVGSVLSGFKGRGPRELGLQSELRQCDLGGDRLKAHSHPGAYSDRFG